MGVGVEVSGWDNEEVSGSDLRVERVDRVRVGKFRQNE
jgi:hypothetical protein